LSDGDGDSDDDDDGLSDGDCKVGNAVGNTDCDGDCVADIEFIMD
jgi:hypothetical protein